MSHSGKDKSNVAQLPKGVTPFIHITQNEFLWRKHKKPREEDIAISECKYDASDPTSACVGRCLNVLTNIECTRGYCRCSETCRNQRFQKCEYAKTKLFRTEGRGWGPLADENIKAGQFIIECCGEVISFEEAKKRSQAYESHGKLSTLEMEYNHVWEDGDDRYMVEDVPLYDSADDESSPVIFGTSGGREHTKILNDIEGSTFKLEPRNSTCKNYNIGSGSTTKKKSQRIPKLKVQLPEGVTPFVHITQNVFLGRKHKKLKDEDIVVCECKYDVNNPETACGERCLNVLTSTECTLGYCQCGENCRNQRFQKREYAKTKLFRTEGRGWGILADENIKAGQFIMEYCGEVLSSEAAKKRCLAYEAHEIKDAYIISMNATYFIDATQKGSLARFINHSCQPNCETRKWIVLGETMVGIFAKRDISVGAELSYNYNFEWYGGAPVRCLCGTPNCSLFLGAKSQGFKEKNHVWEEGDNRYIVDNIPLYDTTDDESSPVISGTSGGNEDTKILNDSEGSTFKLEPSNSPCKNSNIGSGSTTKKKSQRKPKLKECNHVWEEGDNRYTVDNLPLYDSTDGESSLVISGTSGGNEHTKILNDSEASTFKLEPSNSPCKNSNIGSGSTTKKKSQRKPKLKECNHVWEEGDTRYIMDNIPLYDTTDDESSPVISGTSGGNEDTKILNDSEGSTFKLEPSNSTTKKKSQRKPKLKRVKMADPGWNYGKRVSETNKAAVECNFCKKVTNGGIFRHKQHLIGTSKDVTRCEACPDDVREEMKKYVDEKKEQKRQALFQSGDDEDEKMEEGEAEV